MTDIATTIGKKAMKTALGNAPPKKSEIDWADFNHPPLIKVFHYSLDHIKDPHKPIFKYMNFYFLSFFLYFILNFFNSIVQVSVGYKWTRIFASFFYYCIVGNLAGYGFYNLFKEGVKLEGSEQKKINRVSGQVSNKSLMGSLTGCMLHFKISYIILFFLTFLQIIFDTLCWNSLIRMINIYKDGHGFAGTLCLVEFIAVGGLFGVGIWLVFVKVRELEIW